jgi:DHA1 family multidrug resistance protein-like MFS transporter
MTRAASANGDRRARWQAPPAVLAGAFLFNLGQGVLRPTLPLYLRTVFAANYRMVTLIPVVFGAGKWVANLPTGYLLDRFGRRRLMVGGLILIALSDVGSALTFTYGLFLLLRALAGVGWAAFSTVATTTMVDQSSAGRRGRAVSLLFMSETLGLLLGTAAGGWLYQGVSVASPFAFEAACMLAAAVAAARSVLPVAPRSPVPETSHDRGLLRAVLRTPGVLLMGLTNAGLIAIQIGVLVFLFPLYLANQGGLAAETVGLLVSLSVLGRFFALWLGGSVSDRWGRMRPLILALLIYATLLGSVVLLTHPLLLGLWSVALGSAAGFVAPLPTALIGDRVPQGLQAVAIGWLRTMTDTGQILGPLAMGALADAVDLSSPFYLGAALLIATAWRCWSHARAMSTAAVAEGGS